MADRARGLIYLPLFLYVVLLRPYLFLSFPAFERRQPWASI